MAITSGDGYWGEDDSDNIGDTTWDFGDSDDDSTDDSTTVSDETINELETSITQLENRVLGLENDAEKFEKQIGYNETSIEENTTAINDNTQAITDVHYELHSAVEDINANNDQLESLAPEVEQLKKHKFVIPQIYTSGSVINTNQLEIDVDPNKEILEEEVDVIDGSTGQVVLNGGSQVKGEITAVNNDTATVKFNQPPKTDINIIYSAKLPLSDLPADFLKKKFYTEDNKNDMLEVINELKGLESNLRKEIIKPVGVYTKQDSDGNNMLTVSYADTPELSHLVVEKKVDGSWEPYDGSTGRVDI